VLCRAVLCRRYDEPALLQEVEKRLGSSIASLAEDLSLPPELQARLAGASSVSAYLCVNVHVCAIVSCTCKQGKSALLPCCDWFLPCISGAKNTWCQLSPSNMQQAIDV
jgi:hypothetical protein